MSSYTAAATVLLCVLATSCLPADTTASDAAINRPDGDAWQQRSGDGAMAGDSTARAVLAGDRRDAEFPLASPARCHADLRVLAANDATTGPVVDSLSERNCPEGACYEHIGIYPDGAVIHQEIELAGVPIGECLRLGRLNSEKMVDVHAFAEAQKSAILRTDPPNPDYVCARDPLQADYAVDRYRLHVLPNFLRPVWNNIFCHGSDTGWRLKVLIDEWWEIAPRRHRAE